MYFSFKLLSLKHFYNILTHIAGFHLTLIGLFNEKLKLGVKGRKASFGLLESKLTDNNKTLWFHCASLGEYEQGLPVFEQVKTMYPQHKVVLTFFSPSGYEVKKNTPIADVVVYLPLDTSANAKRFLNLVHPELVIFVKYEIWPNYLLEVKKRHIKAILISALFRKNQSFFKPSGRWMQKALFAFNHIFVQNEESKQLLNKIGYNDVTISGDTRFDRVSNQLTIDNTLNFIETFKQDHLCVVVGSSWPDDEALFINFINEDTSNTKYIIAPHNIKSAQISNLKTKLKQTTILYSEKDTSDLQNANVFIIDTIGLLSRIYSYADIAYVGGGLGTSGLHNTLEAAVFGVPIIIGNHYKKFPEASAMIEKQGMFSISNQTELNSVLINLINDEDLRVKSGSQNSTYIKDNQGAVAKIITYLNKS
ncbi:MAG: 3-deoxy-D-manno-octulosonic acid transferase [Flavobacteriaceae bacterium]|nr:3-deoxy-D-manno-octulosonic acid transferase [Flavobacteriaceae bacterium]